MNNILHTELPMPTIEQIEAERKRLREKSRFGRTLKSTVAVLLVAAALAIIVASVWLPVLRIYGTSMTPTINEGDTVVAVKGSSFGCGDVVGLYYGNKLLVKRVIAGPGQWVDIDEEGNVHVDGDLIDEPYLTDKAYGDVNIKLPYQVPDGRYFVMGDHRSTSSDSRNSAVGCIPDERIVGKIILRVWPVSDLGRVH